MNTKTIRKKARCGACKGRIGKVINLVQLEKVAAWDYPCGGNVLTGEDHLACAVLCDQCIESSNTPMEAIEFRGDEVVYHPVDELPEYVPSPAAAFKRAMLEQEN